MKKISSEEVKSAYGLHRFRKAYDMVPRDLIWQVLSTRNVPRGYIEVIEDIYEGVEGSTAMQEHRKEGRGKIRETMKQAGDSFTKILFQHRLGRAGRRPS